MIEGASRRTSEQDGELRLKARDQGMIEMVNEGVRSRND